jgi:hypothetical protein
VRVNIPSSFVVASPAPPQHGGPRSEGAFHLIIFLFIWWTSTRMAFALSTSAWPRQDVLHSAAAAAAHIQSATGPGAPHARGAVIQGSKRKTEKKAGYTGAWHDRGSEELRGLWASCIELGAWSRSVGQSNRVLLVRMGSVVVSSSTGTLAHDLKKWLRYMLSTSLFYFASLSLSLGRPPRGISISFATVHC